MARSAGDLSLFLSVRAGPDERVPLSLTDDLSGWGLALDASPGSSMRRATPFDEGPVELCRSAVRRFQQAGVEIVEIETDIDREAVWRAFMILRQLPIGALYKEAPDDPGAAN